MTNLAFFFFSLPMYQIAFAIVIGGSSKSSSVKFLSPCLAIRFPTNPGYPLSPEVSIYSGNSMAATDGRAPFGFFLLFFLFHF